MRTYNMFVIANVSRIVIAMCVMKSFRGRWMVYGRTARQLFIPICYIREGIVRKLSVSPG